MTLLLNFINYLVIKYLITGTFTINIFIIFYLFLVCSKYKHGNTVMMS